MVRMGILGAGNIAHRFAASLAHVEGAELVAASCRSEEKAVRFLSEVAHADGARGYGSHDELLADEGIDAIYVALPHAWHFEWTKRALEVDKAVLCEKPAMLNASEMTEIAHIAREREVLFMEAMKPRFQPVYGWITDRLPQVGTIKRVEASLCNDMYALIEGKNTYHLMPGAGSGVLLDCGTYCANWIEGLCPPGIENLTNICDCRVNEDGVDIYVDAELKAPGITCELICAFDEARPRIATIEGTDATIEVFELHRPQAARITFADGHIEEAEMSYVVDDFFGEITHFVNLVRRGAHESDVMGLDDSVRVAAILDAVRSKL